MSLYANIQKTAQKQIADKGRIVTLKQTGASTYDAATDTNNLVSTETQVKALVTDYKAYRIDGTIIQAGDKLVSIAAAGTIEPQVNDTIIDGEEEFRVVNIETVQPGPVKIMYKMQVRR